jgi:hypothetical protein
MLWSLALSFIGTPPNEKAGLGRIIEQPARVMQPRQAAFPRVKVLKLEWECRPGAFGAEQFRRKAKYAK